MRFVSLIICMIATTFTQQDPPAFDLQGHRGCRGLMPENTIPAFLKALDLGVNTLELDVVISKDQQVVVSHEPYFNAAFTLKPDGTAVTKSEQKGLVLYQMDYADIKRFDVGSKKNPAFPEQQPQKAYKPLLSEVIEQAEAYRIANKLPAFSYNIELKSDASAYNRSQPEPAHFCALVQAVISRQLTPDRVVIQSFDFAMLKQWKQEVTAGHYPAVRLAALVENLRSPEKNLNELGFIPDIYSPNYRLLSAEKVAWLHKKKIKVIPWTVNQRADMVRVKNWGVDGLITDYPDRALSL